MKFFSILREIIRDTVFFFLSRISFELKNIFRTKIHGQVISSDKKGEGKNF